MFNSNFIVELKLKLLFGLFIYYLKKLKIF